MAADQQMIGMMKAFITEDAKEKAAEIEHKAASQAEVQRDQDVKRTKASLESKHKADLVKVDTDARVARAKQKKELDDRVLQKRVDAVNSIRAAASGQLQSVRSSSVYDDLLLQLTVQAAFVLEGNANVRCLPEDRSRIDLNKAADQANALLKESGRSVSLSLSFSSEALKADSLGGVFLSLDGSQDKPITCDNTLATRLNTCMEEFAPVLRQKLFAERPVCTA